MEKGSIGENMFFIASGSVEVLSDGQIMAILRPGQFFGEIALLFGHMKRTATIKAVTPCILYSLSRHDLMFILNIYPEIAENLQKEAEKRLEGDLDRTRRLAEIL